ncbi:MAG TPA: winged helix-turn-helix domain-containing protein [Armatimonadota bacterium]|jgi:transposase-like protein
MRQDYAKALQVAVLCRLLHQLHWSRQQPIRRALQRDETAIHRWAQERWPALKKSQAHPAQDSLRG